MHDERTSGLKTGDWKGPQMEAEKGGQLEEGLFEEAPQVGP